jgi:hypothetical protein
VPHCSKLFILPCNVTNASHMYFSPNFIFHSCLHCTNLLSPPIHSMLIMSWHKNGHTSHRHVTEWADIYLAPQCAGPPWHGALTPVLPGVELYCNWGKLQQTCLSACAANRATCQSMFRYTSSVKNTNSNAKLQHMDMAIGPNFQVFMKGPWQNIKFPFRAKCMIETIISGTNLYTTLKFTKYLLIS